MKPLRFAFNGSSWDDAADAPLPGSMADRMVSPILEHLGEGVSIDRWPADPADTVNVYLSMPSVFPGRFVKGGVHLAHGCADKRIRVAAKLRDHFAWCVSPGPVFTARMVESGYPREQIAELGYPKLDPLFRGEVPMTHLRDERTRVVVAPTHGGGGERNIGRVDPPAHSGKTRTSWWRLGELLAQLDPCEFDIVLAPHPRHRPDRRATFTEYVGADVVIADGGSTLYEALALGIPLVTPDWIVAEGHKGRDTLEAQIFRDRVGYHADSAAELPDKVRQAAALGLAESDVAFIDGIIPPETRGKAGLLHAEFLAGLR